tara:strand:- start:19649 stop:20266 length:618 start_codon:yes stop_codon:yes gene_type:complete
VAKIGLIDYGMGNIHSVLKAIQNLKEEVLIVNKSSQFNECKALIIPGQGAYDPAIENLKKTGLIDNLNDWIKKGDAFLGICLGLQLLFESSEEGLNKGLGLLKGTIKKIPFEKKQRIPHIGWCNLIPSNDSKLLKMNELDNWFYFDHSYYACPINQEIISATVEYGSINLTAMIEKNNLTACQFHPEKSGKKGEILLSRWIESIN